MAGACRDEGVALLGGETAEMPGFYADGEYDCAGFLVGIVDRPRIVDGSRIRAGDRVFGFPSSGLHTNGYSLARRIVDASPDLFLAARPAELGGRTVAEALLEPHVSYTRDIRRLLDDPAVDAKGFAHITGGGISGNLKRILPADVDVRICAGSWPEPPIFDLLRRSGHVPEDDLRQAFNLGIGMVAVIGGGTDPGIRIGDVVPGSGRVEWVG
jgi:phosphoribosylformylglycinamidine cyclo-ligase